MFRKKITEIDITKIQSLQEAEKQLKKEQSNTINLLYMYKYAGQWKGIFHRYWVRDIEKMLRLDRCMKIVNKTIEKLKAYIYEGKVS